MKANTVHIKVSVFPLLEQATKKVRGGINRVFPKETINILITLSILSFFCCVINTGAICNTTEENFSICNCKNPMSTSGNPNFTEFK